MNIFLGHIALLGGLLALIIIGAFFLAGLVVVITAVMRWFDVPPNG